MKYEDVMEQIYNTIYDNIDIYLSNKAKKGVETTQVLDFIFPKERKIRSIIGGLETSMGTNTWEVLAKKIAICGGYEVLDESHYNNHLMPENIPQEIKDVIHKHENISPFDSCKYTEDVKNVIKEKVEFEITYKKITKGKGVDIVLMKGNTLYLFDIKTTQINAGAGNSFCVSLKEWIAYSLLKYQNTHIKDVKAYIAFPFDPHNGNFWKKEKGKILPLEQNINALCQNEFWNLLSGKEKTWEDILQIFKKIGSSNIRDKHINLFE